MSYLESLGSVMQHDGPDHQLVTPASKAAETTPTAGYAMPTVQVQQPGIAAVSAPAAPAQPPDAEQGMPAQAHPYDTPAINYQPVQFQQPQLGVYQNLSHLLQGG